MRYRLRTLLIVFAIGPMVLAVPWLLGEPIVTLAIWAFILGAIPGLFALAYWMLCRSQANPEMRGEQDQPWNL